MKESLFRKESLEKINSPGQLNRYIRVAEPGSWIMLAAIVLLLVGALVWSIFGTIETSFHACLVADENGAVCYFEEPNQDRIESGMLVRADGANGIITSEPWMEFGPPVEAAQLFSGGISAAEVEFDVPMNGVFDAEVVVERITPISFLLQ